MVSWLAQSRAKEAEEDFRSLKPLPLISDAGAIIGSLLWSLLPLLVCGLFNNSQQAARVRRLHRVENHERPPLARRDGVALWRHGGEPNRESSRVSLVWSSLDSPYAKKVSRRTQTRKNVGLARPRSPQRDAAYTHGLDERERERRQRDKKRASKEASAKSELAPGATRNCPRGRGCRGAGGSGKPAPRCRPRRR